MKKILIQKSQSQLFDDVVTSLENRFDLVHLAEDMMGEGLADAKDSIEGIVIFGLSEQSLRVCKLARNERFANPSVPVAIVADVSTTHPIPFGCERFDRDSIHLIDQYLDNPAAIRALIVEDDAAILEVASMALSRYMDIETASNGNQACDCVESSTYDLVVLDVMLPGISSEKVFELIRKASPETAIVVITAFDTEKIESLFTLKGAAAYIQKPFLSNAMFRQQCMDAILSHWASNDAARLEQTREAAERAHKEHVKRMSRYL